MDEEVYTTEEIFERDTPLTENLFDNSDGFTLSPLTMLRRYMAKKELQKQNEEMEDEMEMDSEPMSYMNGGGIGSMMQPRQNYAIGGDIQNIINAAYPEGNLQSIINSSLNQKDYNINATKDLVENLPGGVLRDMLAPAAAATLSLPYDGIQAYQRMKPGSGLSGYKDAFMAENPFSSLKERTIGAAGPLAERLSGMNFGMSEAAASEIDVNDLTNRNNGNFLISAANALPNQTGTINSATNIMSPGVRTMEGSLIDGDDPSSRYAVQKDFPTNGIAAALGSSRSNQLEGYQDMIMNPEGFPNALQNLERFQDNRFSDLDFQPGYDFIDAPNKTNTLLDLYQNRGYNNNPYTGFIDKNIMSRGNPNESLVNKTKEEIMGVGKFGKNLALGAFGKMASLPMGIASILGNAFTRNPKSPSYQTYSPNINYSNLNTNNLNDFYDSNEESDTFGTTRFDRAKPGSFASFRTLSDYFNRNKKKAETIGQDKVKADKMAADLVTKQKADAARQAYMARAQRTADSRDSSQGNTVTGFGKSGLGRDPNDRA